jgi:primosomal protein N' (replication factor Y)
MLSQSLNDKILGPVNAPIYRVRQKYRQRLLIRSKKGTNIQKRLGEILITYKLPKEIKLTVDVDPITFN